MRAAVTAAAAVALISCLYLTTDLASRVPLLPLYCLRSLPDLRVRRVPAASPLTTGLCRRWSGATCGVPFRLPFAAGPSRLRYAGWLAGWPFNALGWAMFPVLLCPVGSAHHSHVAQHKLHVIHCTASGGHLESFACPSRGTAHTYNQPRADWVTCRVAWQTLSGCQAGAGSQTHPSSPLPHCDSATLDSVACGACSSSPDRHCNGCLHGCLCPTCLPACLPPRFVSRSGLQQHRRV